MSPKTVVKLSRLIVLLGCWLTVCAFPGIRSQEARADAAQPASSLADYDLAGEALKKPEQGHVAYTIPSKFDAPNFHGCWYFERVTNSSHSYLFIGPLGPTNESPKEVMAYVRGHINDVFPFGCRGHSTNTVQANYVYTVTRYLPFGSKVECVSAGDTQFLFQTLHHHVFHGTVVFGTVKDAAGNLFFFNQGRGDATEPEYKAVANNLTAGLLWLDMNYKIRVALHTESALPNFIESYLARHLARAAAGTVKRVMTAPDSDQDASGAGDNGDPPLSSNGGAPPASSGNDNSGTDGAASGGAGDSGGDQGDNGDSGGGDN